MNQAQPYTLLATMAGGPQVVTFALDELLRQGEQIDQVIVVYLSPRDDPLIGQALARLAAEFNGDRYRGRPCRLHFYPLRRGRERLEDIRDDDTASLAWSAIAELVAGLKAEERRLHACIAGGRRMLALLFMSAAMLHFDQRDRLWHLYTPAPFLEQARDGAIMHARPEDGVRLIQTPLLPLGVYFPGVRAMTQAPPAQALARHLRWLDQAERQRCRQVVDSLTRKQRETLLAFAEGLTPQETAERMAISLSTVDSHKTPILDACRSAWAIPDEERLDYHFLRERFGPFIGDLL